MGEFTLITGRSGAGKSHILKKRAGELLAKGERVLYLVPEQFTFETERALSEYLGPGLLDVTVCSFTSLARRVLRETGERRVFLSSQGRRMVIRKCAEEHAGALTAFARVSGRAGFTQECDGFFTQCKRFAILPEDLAAACEKLPPHTQLRDKLHDLGLLYAAVEEHLRGRNMDAEDAFEALKERLPQSGAAGCHVLIDGFDLVSEGLYGVMGVLASLAPSLTIALRADVSPRCRDRAVFAADIRVMGRLEDMARELGLPLRHISLPEGNGELPVKKAPALLHLEREGFAYPPRPYPGTDGADALELFAGTDVRAEAEAVADAVLSMADAGVRYRDMAVIAADMPLYLEPVSRALRARGVPFFTDAKHPLAQYPAARLMVSAYRAAARGYPKEELLRVVKTGLAGVTDEDADCFENYVLSRGVRGAGFTKPFPEDAPEGAERARQRLMGPLEDLAVALQNAPSAGDKAAALYGYLVAIHLRETLVALTDALKEQGRLEWMEETAQVFNMIVELISQLHAILGEAKTSNSRFLAVLEEGLSTYEVGVIPTTADQLLFGSLGRSRARELEALFVLGAANGVFPATVGDDGMIDDEELGRLEELGVTGLPDTLRRTDKELADVYGAVTKPKRKLYLSYTMGAGADARLPSDLMTRILALYPGVRMSTDVGAFAKENPVSKESAFQALVAGLRYAADSGEARPETARLYRAFAMGGGQDEKRLRRVEEALFPEISPEPFGGELAGLLYGAPLAGGPTQLETYNSCPFRHFARYGLKILPRREFRERKMDEGLFCHEALSLFTKALIESKREPKTLTDDDVFAMMDAILPPLIRDHNNGVLLDTARNRAACARLIRRVKLTACAVVKQLALGDFRLERSEAEFGVGKAYPPIVLELAGGRRFILSGRIDRVDGYEDAAGSRYVRVVDYKSRSGSYFDCKELADGIKLQLPLYLAAVAAAGAVERKAGMFYLPVQEASVPEALLNKGEKALEERLLSEFRLRGALLSDELLIRAGGGGAVLPGERSGWRLTREELGAVEEFALEKARLTAGAIARGEAAAFPYRGKGGKPACAWCDYGSVCGFDPMLPGCAYRGASRLKTDEFIKEACHEKLDR